MNWRRYSLSIKSSQAPAVTPISPSRDEADAVIDPFGPLFVVDDKRLDALRGGPAWEFETFSTSRAQIRMAVQKQQVAGEFLLRIVGARQQCKSLVNVK